MLIKTGMFDINHSKIAFSITKIFKAPQCTHTSNVPRSPLLEKNMKQMCILAVYQLIDPHGLSLLIAHPAIHHCKWIASSRSRKICTCVPKRFNIFALCFHSAVNCQGTVWVCHFKTCSALSMEHSWRVIVCRKYYLVLSHSSFLDISGWICLSDYHLYCLREHRCLLRRYSFCFAEAL